MAHSMCMVTVKSMVSSVTVMVVIMSMMRASITAGIVHLVNLRLRIGKPVPDASTSRPTVEGGTTTGRGL